MICNCVFFSCQFQSDQLSQVNRDSKGFNNSEITTCLKPAHPDPKFIVVQTRANYVLHFQQKWFQMFPWLQYSATLKGVLCFYCAKVFLKKSMLASKFDPAFVSTGFKNWKKAVEKLQPMLKVTPTAMQQLCMLKKQT